MAPKGPLIFLSHAGEDAFEASLLQSSLEPLLGDLGVKVWAYNRDQRADERTIAGSLAKKRRRIG